MGIWQNLKLFMGFEEEEDFPKFDEAGGEFEASLSKDELRASMLRQKKDTHQMKTKKASLIDFQSLQKKGSKAQSDFSAFSTEMVITEPRTYEDSVTLSTYLKQGKPVIVNLKYLDADAGKRLVDFVCGTVYAFEGHMQKLGGHIFLFTPKNIGIISTQKDESEFSCNFNEDAIYSPKETVQEDMFYKTAAG